MTAGARPTGAATGSGDCASGSISADGSSAQANAMTTWTTNFQKKCSGATVNYTSTNSGQGVSDFTAGKIAFAGSDAGGRRAAAMYSLIESAKLNGINPQHYLADVLKRIADHPARRIDELLPWNWQPIGDARVAA